MILHTRQALEFVAAEIEAGLRHNRLAIQRALDWNSFPRSYRLLFLAQLGTCLICDSPMAVGKLGHGPHYATIEHVVPRSCGGGRGDNIVLTHRRCNYSRGNAPPTPELLARAAEARDRLRRYEALVRG